MDPPREASGFGRPPQPPRPLLPRPKPRWRRGAKRLDAAVGPVITTTGRGYISPPGVMNANLFESIWLFCMCGHERPLQPSSLTRGRPPHPPRPLLPRPKPRWRRGAKRLDGAVGPVVTTTGRGCGSPPGLMNANLYGSICLYCMSCHEGPLQPISLTRGRPPPPRPLLPRPKPRWRRGAKRLDGAVVRCEV